MLSHKKISKIVDYFDSKECFPGVHISGGISHFLWSSKTAKDRELKQSEVVLDQA